MVTEAEKKQQVEKWVENGSNFEVVDVLTLPQCIICNFLIDVEKQRCEAYPEKISDDIFLGDKAHNKVFPDQVGDFIFDPIEDVIA